MAKRACQKPKKRREPAWMTAARARLRGDTDAFHQREMTDAFLDLASPFLKNLAHDADDRLITRVLDSLKAAWNLPIVHALPTEPGSGGADIRAEVAAWLSGSPHVRASMVQVVKARIEEFPHCGAALADVLWERTASHNTIALRFYGDDVPASRMLDVDENGWPKASHSLLELSRPARDLLTVPYGDEEARSAIGLARVAWNLPFLDVDRSLVSEDLRRETLEGARRAREADPARRAAFDAMLIARTERFSYDHRVIALASTSTEGDMIRLNTAALRLDAAPLDPV